MNVEITHSRVRLLVWSCSCCSPFGAHHGLAEDESHRAYGGRDVNGKNGAALAASHDHCDHQDQEGDSARQHGRCLALAAAQREPDDEARQRREDEQVPEGLMPALPHVVAAQKAAGERRFQENAVVRGAATRRSAGIAWVIRWSPSRGPRTRGRSSRATDCPIERLDRAPGNGHDRTPADTAHRPGAGRTQLGDLLGPGLLPRTDPPGDHGSGAHRERGIPVPACGYDATLPSREVREVGQVCEDVLGTTGYLDALYDGAISPPLIIVCCDRPHPSSSSARSSRDRRSGSARMSISTIFPRVTVKPRTDTGRPPGAATTPAAPFTSAGRANGPSRRA